MYFHLQLLRLESLSVLRRLSWIIGLVLVDSGVDLLFYFNQYLLSIITLGDLHMYGVYQIALFPAMGRCRARSKFTQLAVNSCKN